MTNFRGRDKRHSPLSSQICHWGQQLVCQKWGTASDGASESSSWGSDDQIEQDFKNSFVQNKHQPHPLAPSGLGTHKIADPFVNMCIEKRAAGAGLLASLTPGLAAQPRSP